GGGGDDAITSLCVVSSSSSHRAPPSLLLVARVRALDALPLPASLSSSAASIARLAVGAAPWSSPLAVRAASVAEVRARACVRARRRHARSRCGPPRLGRLVASPRRRRLRSLSFSLASFARTCRTHALSTCDVGGSLCLYDCRASLARTVCERS